MAKSYWDQDLEEFNPYYAQFYNKDGSAKTSQNDDSKDTLRNSENNALSKNEQSFYRGSGRSQENIKGKKQKGAWLFAKNGQLIVRKKGFAGLILSLALMAGGGAFLGSTNSLLAPALNEVVTEVTDLQHAANSKRYVKLTSNILNGSETKPTFFGAWTGRKKYVHMSNSFKKRLASQGITVEGTGANKTLSFTHSTPSGGTETISGITANEFLETYTDNVEFRDAYNTAKRGRIMGFFDEKADAIYQKLGISRNINKDYKQSGDAEADNQKFRENMTEELDADSDNLDSKSNRITEETEYEEDANGNKVPKQDENGNTVTKEQNNETTTSTKNADGDTPTAKATSYLNKIAGTVSQVTNWGCTIMKMLNMVSVAVAANEIMQSIDYFMGLAENPSKMKMGYGDESAINSMLNFMTTPAETEVENYRDEPTITGSVDSEDLEVTLQKKIKTNGSPMEAQGMVKIMTGSSIDKGMAKNYSLERSLTVLGGAVTTTKEAFMTCAIAQGAASLVSGIATIATAVATGGASLLASFTWKAIGSAALSIAIVSFLRFMIPTIAMTFFTNAFENATGIPAGELYAKGAFAANTRIARTASSQSPSSEDEIRAYNKINQEVIAMDAEVDRNNRSPFDITSRNTFLGSIAYNFGTTTSTSFTGKIKNLMRNTSSSVAKIIGNGATIAAGENDYITTYGDCPLLENIGAKGDIYCNPITTSDPDLLNLSPDDDLYIEKINPGLSADGLTSDNLKCDTEGNCEVVDGSNLAKYITYCNGRNSPFGAVDANILESAAGGHVAMNVIGMIPVIGDAISIIDAAKDANNLSWATGEKCVNSSSNPDWDNELRYYQLYAQDQRILEQMGNYEGSKSPINAYIEKYEAEHPLDNTPSGYLARISGLSKDDAQLVLDIAWYYNYLNEYDATTRIAMDGTASDTLSGEEVIAKLDYEFRYKGFEKNFESDNHASKAIVAEHIIYADVRNRSYAV